LALACLVAGIVGPRWGIYMEKQRVFGRDIVVALDVSRSMLAEDVEPNRFERAKREIRQQLTERGAFAQSNRLALLAFAGSTSLRMPLTTDTVAFRSKLEQLTIGAAPRGGTAIGDAIRKSVDLFAKSPAEAEKIILLVTDGEDHEGGPVDAAREAWDKDGIRVYTIAVGDPSSAVGAQVPAGPGSDKPLLYQGQIVFSKLNSEALREIAQAGAGEYVPVTEMFRAVNKISSMKKAELSAEERMRHQPRYQWFVAAALLLLLVESLISDMRKDAGEPMRIWQQEAA
jgi:Ca-activated chloride channel family protein